MWSQPLGFHDLSNLIVARSNPFAWDGFIDQLRHVNSKLIAGLGRLPDGQLVPFILTAVPEPASASAAMLGLVGTLFCYRRERPQFRSGRAIG